MRIPLMNRLQKRAQRDVALFEDVLIRVIYSIDTTAEIHGGTAIWRCYGGKRFSKDIDVYLASQEKWKELKEKIEKTAELYNAKVIKLKDTGNLLYISLLMGDIYSEIDINYKSYYENPVVRQYENLDGTFYDISTLPPEALIAEKIAAYEDRKSITDIYDIKILLDSVEIKKVKGAIARFVSNLQQPDQLEQEEERLKGLIYEGPIPSFKSIVESIKARVK